MKSILKQVLTVALLLSVPVVFAAEQKEAVAVATVAAEKAVTGRLASMKSGVKAGYSKASTYVSESKPGKFVAKHAKSASDYAKETRVVKLASAKTEQLRNWTFNNDSKYKTAGKVAVVAAATGALAYGLYKLPSMYRKFVYNDAQRAKYANKLADRELAKAVKAEAKAKAALDKAANAVKTAGDKATEKAKKALVEATAAYTKARNLVIALTPVNQDVVRPVMTTVVHTPVAPVKTGPSAQEKAQARKDIDCLNGLIAQYPNDRAAYAPKLAAAEAVLAA